MTNNLGNTDIFFPSAPRNNKIRASLLRCSKMESSDDLSSRAVSSQVLSALKGLTSVFGMGTGGTPSPLPLEIVSLSAAHGQLLRPSRRPASLNLFHKRRASLIEMLFIGIRRRPILPGRFQPSTFGAEGLNFCVRYGNRWDPFAITTGNCIIFISAP